MSVDTNNKRIAKNTLFLYFRMLLVMLVTLFTSRVVLNTLGAEDYGLYNVVAGIVTMFGFLSGAMSGATSRYITFELGRGDKIRLKNTFSASLGLYIIAAGLIFFLGEVVGLWFVYEKLVMPEGRLTAALVVLHLSILTASISCLLIPYTATIIAHENMTVYAYVGIYEALSKLAIAYAILVSPFDKLIFYAFLLFANQTMITLFYIIYSRHKYSECRLCIVRDKSMYKELATYSFYDMIGSSAFVIQTQGINMLLNVFFGPVVNAARAIAVQINGAIIQLVNNFLMAVKPQVIKNYAQGDIDGMYSLTMYATKFAYYLLFILSCPLFFEMDTILALWLGDECPEETVAFCQIMLVLGLVQVFIYSINMVMHAIGRLKEPCLLNTAFYFAPLPVSYLAFKLGAPAYTAFIIVVVFYIGIYINTTYWMNRFERMDLKYLFNNILLRCILVTLFACIVPIVVNKSMSEGIFRLVTNTICTCVYIILIIGIVGINSKEKNLIYILLKKKLKRQ